MESTYRNALRNNRKILPDKVKLFASGWTYLSAEQLTADLKPYKIETPPVKVRKKLIIEKKSITEKAKVLDSLYQFSQEKIKEMSEGQSSGPSNNTYVVKADARGKTSVIKYSRDEFRSILKQTLGEELYKKRFEYKDVSNPEAVKVVFVSDKYLGPSEIISNEDYLDIPSCFDEAVSHLFSRMIVAMNLKGNEFTISALEVEKTECLDLLKAEIFYFKPDLVITLGAMATNQLLGSSRRLKDIHGTFTGIELVTESGENLPVEVMPLFSPKLLVTAPNMKKTAWKDMQGAMEKIKK